jgi:endogenous inhibitor of DNA gyrase (YacG/DUF329 family)
MKASCPICKKEADWEGNEYRPFCSERCKLIDLGRWAGEKYRIPVVPPEGEETPDQDKTLPEEKQNGDRNGSRGK